MNGKVLSTILLTALVATGTSAQPPALTTGGETFDDVADLLGSVSWSSPVYAAAWSPNGDVVATGSGDGAVHLWDPVTGREIRRLHETGNRRPVRSVAFSGTAFSGTKVAAAFRDDALVRIWDLERSAEPIGRQRGWTVAWSPDGRFLATGLRDGTVHLVESGQLTDDQAVTPRSLESHTKEVSTLAWNGTRLASGSWDGTVAVWDTNDDSLIVSLAGHLMEVNSVAWSPDGEKIASASSDGTVRVWSVAAGDEIYRVEAPGTAFRAVAWAGDGRTLVTGAADRSIQFWDARRGGDREIGSLSGHMGEVYAVAFSPGGQRLVSASADGTARIWAVASGREVLRLRGNAAELSALAVSRQGTMAVGSEGKSIRVWNPEPALGPTRLSLDGNRTLHAVAVGLDGTRVAAGFGDGTVEVWIDGSIRGSERLHQANVSAVAFSPDGQDLASASEGRLVIWDLDDLSDPVEIQGPSGRPSALAWDPEGSQLALATREGQVRTWDRQIPGSTRGGFRGIVSLAFPAADEIWVLQRDQSLWKWNPSANTAPRQVARLPERFSSVALSPDGRFLASVKWGERIARLSVRTAEGSYVVEQRLLAGADNGTWMACGSKQCWRHDDGSLLLRRDERGMLSPVPPPWPGEVPRIELAEPLEEIRVADGKAASFVLKVANRGARPAFWIGVRSASADRRLVFEPPRPAAILLPGETVDLRCGLSPHTDFEDPKGWTGSLTLELTSAHAPSQALPPVPVTVQVPSLRWGSVRRSEDSLSVTLSSGGQQPFPGVEVSVLLPDHGLELESVTVEPIAAGEGRTVSFPIPASVERGAEGRIELTARTVDHPLHLWSGERSLNAWPRRLQIGLAGVAVAVLVLFVVSFVRKRRQGAVRAGEDADDDLREAHLRDFSELLQASRDRDEAYRIVAARLSRRVFPNMTGALLVLTDDDHLTTACSWPQPTRDRESFERYDCLVLRQTRDVESIDRDAEIICDHGVEKGPCYVCVRCQARGRTHGVLHLRSRDAKQESFLPADLDLAKKAAGEIGRTLAQLKEIEQSYRDDLTGLLDRRRWNEQLEKRVQNLIDDARPFGVIMLDVDHFGKFNKEHGHETGDAVLRELGQLLQTQTRGEDIVCRYGGEEFLALLPGASIEVTFERAEQLRRAVHQVRVQSQEDEDRELSVAISVGVAAHPDHGASWQVVKKAADAALRRAKKAGRDRVEKAVVEDAGTPPQGD